jgi:predicted TIM-barrel fold metal-dependent hydrolase
MTTGKVIDCDGHVTETEEVFEKYMDKPYRDSRPKMVRGTWGKEWWMLENRFYTYNAADSGEKLPDFMELANTRPGGTDPDARLKDLNDSGIDIAVMFGGLMAGLNTIQDGGLAGAMCNAYNKWVAEFCSTAPDRMKWLAYVPLHDMHVAPKMARKAVKNGAVGIVIAPSMHAILGKTLDSEYFNPLWEELQDLDVPASIHDNAVSVPDSAGGQMTNSCFPLMHASAFPFDNMLALGWLIYGGVLDKFPKLRVGFMESGVGWLGFWRDRLQGQLKMPYPLAFGRKHPISEYIEGGQLYFSCEGEDNWIPEAIRVAGEDHILWASDYPHWDADDVEDALGDIRKKEGVSDKQKAKILGDNAARYFRI